MLQFLLVHIAVALVAPALMHKFGRKGFIVLAALPASVAIWALTQTSAVLNGTGPHVSIEWIPALGMNLTFTIDTLSWLMMMLVGGIGAFVLLYCAWYFSSGAKALGRFAGVFIAFAGAMLGLVTTDNTLVMYTFWELTTVFSYLLIGHYFDRQGSRRAAQQSIVVTTLGGLAMLGGIVMLGGMPGGSYSFSELVANPPAHSLVPTAIVLILVGAVTKSALIPFHYWLPGAMAAPTPVSAYLHAAAMVKAGVYLVARLAPGYATLPIWQWMILILGGGTMLLGGYRALRQNDLKLLLAFGTVSQLGFLILLVGQADRGIALAGLSLVGAHAMFKAALFLTVGVIDAATGTRDLRELSGLGSNLRWAAIPGIIAAASMVGLPPTAGYVGKEAVLHALETSDSPHSIAMMVIVVLGSVLTFAYGARFCWGAFARKKGVADTKIDNESPWLFVSPNVLALAGVVAGLVPSLGQNLLTGHAQQYPEGELVELSLWSGFGLPVVLTLGIIAAGVGLFLAREQVESLQEKISKAPSADHEYRRTMRKLDQFSTQLTSRTQRGSLPLYLGIILATTAVAAVVPLISGQLWPQEVKLWDHPAQAPVAAVIIVGAFLAARSRRRLKSVVLLGITGYGIVLLFELQGAPDLALTQALVETVTLVVFILVLRRLPAYFSNRPLASDRWWRIAVAAATALVVMWLALVIPGARIHDPVSVDFPEEAYNYGYGTNIVNVTLVDVRAWDTMGEISVLLAAATGVASLLFIRTRSRGVERVKDAPDDPVWGGGMAQADETKIIQILKRARDTENVPPGRGQALLSGVNTLSPQRRSVIMEMVTRVVFHTLMVFAIYLLVAGHNQPGGGFAAGIVGGIALIVRYLAGGRFELGEAAPVLPGTLLGLGLFLSVGSGIMPLFFGGQVLQSFKFEFTMAIFGEVKIVSTLLFDAGVFLVVVGLVLDILRSLGAEIDRQGEAEGKLAPDIAHDSPRILPEDALTGGEDS